MAFSAAERLAELLPLPLPFEVVAGPLPLRKGEDAATAVVAIFAQFDFFLPTVCALREWLRRALCAMPNHQCEYAPIQHNEVDERRSEVRRPSQFPPSSSGHAC